MLSARFRNHLRFALHKELRQTREASPPNQIERLGDILSWVVYEFRSLFLSTVCDPRFITVIFTLSAMLLTSLLFYPSKTWDIVGNTVHWTVGHINWKYVRFTLWLVSEVTVLGLGIRAFGRFSNKKLMEHHQLVS